MNWNLFGKVYNTYKREGIKKLVESSLSYVYRNSIRSYIPTREVTYKYNGVDIKQETPIIDSYIPPFVHGWSQNIPDYEENSIRNLRKYCKPGDDVVIIGGGFGISTVVAGREVDSDGSVIVYEASSIMTDIINRVININNLNSDIKVHHSVVGRVVSPDIQSNNAKVTPPSDLPEADVYEIDCEGAEKEILSRLNVRPKVIILETHAVFGVPKEGTIPMLEDMGYIINEVSREEEDCHIVVGEHNSS